MRPMMLVAFLALSGAMTMGTATAQEKKFDPSNKDSFNKTASVRKWTGDGLLKAEDVPAYLDERDDKTVIYTIPKNGATQTPAKSEITVDGVTWVVKKSTKTTVNFTVWINTVEKKPEQKPQ